MIIACRGLDVCVLGRCLGSHPVAHLCHAPHRHGEVHARATRSVACQIGSSMVRSICQHMRVCKKRDAGVLMLCSCGRDSVRFTPLDGLSDSTQTRLKSLTRDSFHCRRITQP